MWLWTYVLHAYLPFTTPAISLPHFPARRALASMQSAYRSSDAKVSKWLQHACCLLCIMTLSAAMHCAVCLGEDGWFQDGWPTLEGEFAYMVWCLVLCCGPKNHTNRHASTLHNVVCCHRLKHAFCPSLQCAAALHSPCMLLPTAGGLCQQGRLQVLWLEVD